MRQVIPQRASGSRVSGVTPASMASAAASRTANSVILSTIPMRWDPGNSYPSRMGRRGRARSSRGESLWPRCSRVQYRNDRSQLRDCPADARANRARLRHPELRTTRWRYVVREADARAVGGLLHSTVGDERTRLRQSSRPRDLVHRSQIRSHGGIRRSPRPPPVRGTSSSSATSHVAQELEETKKS